MSVWMLLFFVTASALSAPQFVTAKSLGAESVDKVNSLDKDPNHRLVTDVKKVVIVNEYGNTTAETNITEFDIFKDVNSSLAGGFLNNLHDSIIYLDDDAIVIESIPSTMGAVSQWANKMSQQIEDRFKSVASDVKNFGRSFLSALFSIAG